MAKQVVIRTIQLRPNMRKLVLEAVLAHRDRSLRDEPGTVQFDVLLPDDDEMLILYEVYVDEAALIAHMKAESMQIVREQISNRIFSIKSVNSVLSSES